MPIYQLSIDRQYNLFYLIIMEQPKSSVPMAAVSLAFTINPNNAIALAQQRGAKVNNKEKRQLRDVNPKLMGDQLQVYYFIKIRKQTDFQMIQDQVLNGKNLLSQEQLLLEKPGSVKQLSKSNPKYQQILQAEKYRQYNKQGRKGNYPQLQYTNGQSLRNMNQGAASLPRRQNTIFPSIQKQAAQSVPTQQKVNKVGNAKEVALSLGSTQGQNTLQKDGSNMSLILKKFQPQEQYNQDITKVQMKKGKRDLTPRFQLSAVNNSQDKMKVSRSNVVSSQKKDPSEIQAYFSRDMRSSQNAQVGVCEIPVLVNPSVALANDPSICIQSQESIRQESRNESQRTLNSEKLQTKSAIVTRQEVRQEDFGDQGTAIRHYSRPSMPQYEYNNEIHMNSPQERRNSLNQFMLMKKIPIIPPVLQSSPKLDEDRKQNSSSKLNRESLLRAKNQIYHSVASNGQTSPQSVAGPGPQSQGLVAATAPASGIQAQYSTQERVATANSGSRIGTSNQGGMQNLVFGDQSLLDSSVNHSRVFVEQNEPSVSNNIQMVYNQTNSGIPMQSLLKISKYTKNVQVQQQLQFINNSNISNITNNSAAPKSQSMIPNVLVKNETTNDNKSSHGDDVVNDESKSGIGFNNMSNSNNMYQIQNAILQAQLNLNKKGVFTTDRFIRAFGVCAGQFQFNQNQNTSIEHGEEKLQAGEVQLEPNKLYFTGTSVCELHERVLKLILSCPSKLLDKPTPVLPAAPGSGKEQDNSQARSSTQSNLTSSVNPNVSRRNPNQGGAGRRNKNPNCNHNSNSVFYQPYYNNVKYDDQYKKKEEILKKVFFSDRLKGAHHKVDPQDTQNQLPHSTTNKGNGSQAKRNPEEEEKEMERRLLQQLFHGGSGVGDSSSRSKNSSKMKDLNHSIELPSASTPGTHISTLEHNTPKYKSLIDRKTSAVSHQLDLHRLAMQHKTFIFAIVKCFRLQKDSFLKLISEFKCNLDGFDAQCFYCCFSVNTVIETHKQLQEKEGHSLDLLTENDFSKLTAENASLQLVDLFQRHLIKKGYGAALQLGHKFKEQALNGVNLGKKEAKKAINHPSPVKPKKPKDFKDPLKYTNKKTDSEKLFEKREKQYRQWLMQLNKSNGITGQLHSQILNPEKPSRLQFHYKYIVGRGNNSILVRMTLKQRWWWSKGSWEDYNYVWMQCKSKKAMEMIKPAAVKEKELKDKEKDSSKVNKAPETPSQDSDTMSTKAHTEISEGRLDVGQSTPSKARRSNTFQSKTFGQSVSQSINGGLGVMRSADKGKNKARNQTISDEQPSISPTLKKDPTIIHNHLECHYHLSNKKALFYNFKTYCEHQGIDPFQFIPITYHIKEGTSDKEFLKFTDHYFQIQKDNELKKNKNKNIWIVKPGENTNRGCGINVARDLEHIKQMVSQNISSGTEKRSYIIQKYIERPLLFKGRKFDIRAFMLVTSINGNLQAYWYQDGYLRTSCKEFNIRNVDNKFIHLTNDAIQKRSDDYGRYENGNKVSYSDFQRYMDKDFPDYKLNMNDDILPKIKQIAIDSIKCAYWKLDPNKRSPSYEVSLKIQFYQLFGFDFMIDDDLTPWLIECNTNPCLDLSSPLLSRLIPTMLENVARIAIDPILPPPYGQQYKRHLLPDPAENKFISVFNEITDAESLKHIPKNDLMIEMIEEEEEDSDEDGSGISDEDEKE